MKCTSGASIFAVLVSASALALACIMSTFPAFTYLFNISVMIKIKAKQVCLLVLRPVAV